uniref:Uncharacterized protein n=1 Tax=Anguilla anguilla TaxID=7936 RepID=A0A0E9UNV3_ANGAN
MVMGLIPGSSLKKVSGEAVRVYSFEIK